MSVKPWRARYKSIVNRESRGQKNENKTNVHGTKVYRGTESPEKRNENKTKNAQGAVLMVVASSIWKFVNMTWTCWDFFYDC